MDGWETEPLTCSQSKGGEEWSMQLPAATTEDIAPVEVDLVGPAEALEVFMLTDGIVSIKDAADVCILGEEVELEFNLKSDVVGTNEQKLSVQIEKKVEEDDDDDDDGGDDDGPVETGTQVGVKITASSEDKDNKSSSSYVPEAKPSRPLKVSKVKMSPTGLLSISFSKAIVLPLPFEVYDPDKKTRLLQNKKLEDAFSVGV